MNKKALTILSALILILAGSVFFYIKKQNGDVDDYSQLDRSQFKKDPSLKVPQMGKAESGTMK